MDHERGTFLEILEGTIPRNHHALTALVVEDGRARRDLVLARIREYGVYPCHGPKRRANGLQVDRRIDVHVERIIVVEAHGAKTGPETGSSPSPPSTPVSSAPPPPPPPPPRVPRPRPPRPARPCPPPSRSRGTRRATARSRLPRCCRA